MNRVPYSDKGSFWSKTFNTVNKDIDSNRYSFDSTAFPVLSFKVMLENGKVTSTLPTEELSVRFGQAIIPFKNIDLLSKVFNSFDISINKEGFFNNSSDKGKVPQLLKEGLSLKDFFKKYGYTSDTDVSISLPKDFLKYEVGVSKIKQPIAINGELSKFEYFEVDQALRLIEDSCFSWFQIDKNNRLIKDAEAFKTSSPLLLDTRCTIDTGRLTKWIDDFITPPLLNNVLETLDTTVLEVSLLLYPPTLTSMQLTDKPVIINPPSILKNKVIEEVSFNVSTSLVAHSQKMFEVIFQDSEDDSLIFKANSIDSSENFFIIGKKIHTTPFKFQLENSVFEDLSGTQYPTGPFKVLYKIPKNIQAFLSNNLKYKIIVRITDLTSER